MVKTKGSEKKDKELEKEIEEAEEELEEVEEEVNGGDADEHRIAVRASKPVEKVKKGDKIKVDGLVLEVDSHYVLIDHGTTKEMAIELFDPKTDKDYQIRYFSDQMESTIEFYELQEIMYLKRSCQKIEW